jgi:hypothetical protein
MDQRWVENEGGGELQALWVVRIDPTDFKNSTVRDHRGGEPIVAKPYGSKVACRCHRILCHLESAKDSMRTSTRRDLDGPLLLAVHDLLSLALSPKTCCLFDRLFGEVVRATYSRQLRLSNLIHRSSR